MKKTIIVLGLIVLTLVLSGCTGSDYEYIAEDYQKHLDTLEEDAATYSTTIEKWNTALSMAESDEEYTDEEILQLETIANEFVDQFNYIVPHLDSFEQFIETNEFELKDMGVDTYQDKKDIDDIYTKMLSADDNIRVFFE